MIPYDREKAARVMQRVRETASPPENTPQDPHGLKAMIADETAAATVYLHLSRHYTAEEAAMLRKMSQQEQSHTTCLKGIYTLLTGQHLPLQSAQPVQGTKEVLLRRCYLQELRSAAAYEARQNDPEYGSVFSQLAQEERQHSRQVLFLLGNLK